MVKNVTAQKPSQQAPHRAQEGEPAASGSLSPRNDSNPFAGLQRTLGNQAMLRLIESGGLQAKLRISQPGDADEQEADRIADQIVSAKHAPTIQRKCACGGSCSKCAGGEEEEMIHRSVAPPHLRSSPLSLQRATADSAAPAPTESTAPPSTSGPASGKQRTAALIIDDDAPSIAPTQMRKTQFIALLQTTACATADAVLASVKHTTRGCPYIKKWLDHYKDKDAQHLTRAIYKYAPETRNAHTAYEAITLLNQRIHQAAVSWVKTGKVSGMPPDLQAEMMGGGGGFLGAVAGFASSGFGSALLGFLGGGKKGEAADSGTLQKKAQPGGDAGPHDAATVRSQLGSGHSLDSRVQHQMSSAFGYDFSGVRVHTDSRSAGLSADLQARAFTIGSDVAFAVGEYQPGTPIGDALIAHELAHVVQQGGGRQPTVPMPKSKEASDGQLEEDADRSAIGAVVSAWTGAKQGLAKIGHDSLPRLRSGLRLQRCGRHDPVPTATPEIPTTQEELGKHAVACMAAANKGPHSKDSGVWYAFRYKAKFPDDWDDDWDDGYANPEYWERTDHMQWRLKKGRSASAGVKAWLKGLTIAECQSTAIVAEVDAVRAGTGDAKFDELYGSEDKAVEPRLTLGVLGSNALTGKLKFTDTSGGIGTIGHRPATVGEWHYFYNHPKYLLKHPGGVYQGENAMLREETADNGDQLWEGLGQAKVTERRMYMYMMGDYNRKRDSEDERALDGIRKKHGGVLPPEYDPASGIFPDKLTSYEDILNAPPYTIDGRERKGGYSPGSGQRLDPHEVEKLRSQP